MMAEGSEGGMSEYELQRLEHIRRNQECLERLGLADGSFMALLNPMAGSAVSLSLRLSCHCKEIRYPRRLGRQYLSVL